MFHSVLQSKMPGPIHQNFFFSKKIDKRKNSIMNSKFKWHVAFQSNSGWRLVSSNRVVIDENQFDSGKGQSLRGALAR